MNREATHTRGFRVGIAIPFHNEEACLKYALESWCRQTRKPDRLVLVNDGSTDKSPSIAAHYAGMHDWIELVTPDWEKDTRHLPGSKVIQAFYRGFPLLSDYDLLGKFDADIEMPVDYLETICGVFADNPRLGVCSGELYIEKNGSWIRENTADRGHVRGPVKLYRRECFEAIDGLRHSVGWDTVDVLLARYHGFEVRTLSGLRVNHLRPTGHGYSRRSDTSRGIALYKMRYDPLLAAISAIKMGLNDRSILKSTSVYCGYWQGWIRSEHKPFVRPEEGRFIRRYRWRGIIKKLFGPRRRD